MENKLKNLANNWWGRFEEVVEDLEEMGFEVEAFGESLSVVDTDTEEEVVLEVEKVGGSTWVVASLRIA